MEYKRLIKDFSSVLNQNNIFIISSKFNDKIAAKNITILHLEKENETLRDILEIIACVNSTRIINEKLNNNIKQINKLKSLYQEEI